MVWSPRFAGETAVGNVGRRNFTEIFHPIAIVSSDCCGCVAALVNPSVRGREMVQMARERGSKFLNSKMLDVTRGDSSERTWPLPCSGNYYRSRSAEPPFPNHLAQENDFMRMDLARHQLRAQQ